MYSQFQDALNIYLFPFLIAVPVAVVLVLLAVRRDDRGPLDGSGEPDVPPTAARPSRPIEQTQEASVEPAPHDLEPVQLTPGPLHATVLVVDDSAVARAKLRKLFESAGYPVQVARDGVEALELLGKHRFGLMVTDLEMPKMDGIQLIAAVSGSLETEDMPILAITGHDDLQAKVHECQGLYGIFKKPWNDRELLRRVETLMRVRQPDMAMN